MKRKFVALATAIAVPMAGAGLLKTNLSIVSVPEEDGLNLKKITATANRVADYRGRLVSHTSTILGHNKITETKWWVPAQIALSPDGTCIAYINEKDGRTEAMVKSLKESTASTRRIPSANVVSLSWNDGSNILCLTERHGKSFSVRIIDALSGVSTAQVTGGNGQDLCGTVSADGETVFFHRADGVSGYNLWSYDMGTRHSTKLAPGMTICLVHDAPDEAYCARINNRNESEIWHVNLKTGVEELILAKQGTSFTTPQLSPDGKWILATGNSLYGKDNVANTDIFAIRTDGTRLTRLTFHPGNDLSAIWSHDGRSIYFLSQRGSKQRKYNIWKMDFNL
ncbi:MAG TPA: hypothetical protein H9986_07820 [Candidatus Prevotella stercoripullorum]|nr:hypothetical protein [Candidatus Prevotella stercoripullorum]